MKTEFEVVFAPVERESIREKLKNIGAKCTKVNTLMKRIVFANPEDSENSYLRIRDEWGKITCCLKTVAEWDLDIESVKELETQVDDFEIMKNIFLWVWLKQKSYQETYREIWELPWKVDFMIDEWPGMSPFIEIEWPNEKIVKEYSEKLWFHYDKAIFWTVDQVYKKILWFEEWYINNLPEITFVNPPKK